MNLLRGRLKACVDLGRICLSSLNLWSRTRPYSAIGAFTCLVLIGLLSLSLAKSFRIEQRTIWIYPRVSDGAKITNVMIDIKQEKGRDKLRLIVNAKSNSTADTGILSITHSDNISRKAHAGHSSGLSFEEPYSNILESGVKEVVERCPFVPREQHSFYEEYAGPILLTNAKELQLTLEVPRSGKEKFPLLITFNGLSAISIDGAFPSPDQRTDDALYYRFEKFDPDEPFDSSVSIKLRLTNRQRSYGDEYKIFLIGVLFGVCSSFLASIIYDAIREAEKRQYA